METGNLRDTNGHLEFVWGRYDALWLPRNLFNELKERGLAPEMSDLGSAHGIFVNDPELSLEEKRIGGANILLGYDYLLVDAFWIQSSHRRQSIGRRLLEEVERFGRKSAKRRILLSTFEFQDGLQFWIACGFKEVGKIDDYPAGQQLIYLHKRL